MKKIALYAATGIILTVLVVVLASGCGWGHASPPAGNSAVNTAEPPKVPTTYPERQTLRRFIEQPGQIEGFQQTPLYAKISGYVDKLHVDIGDRVYAGQLLAELSIPETVEEHHQKQATVVQAGAEVTQANKVLTATEANLKKAEAAIRLAEAVKTRADAGLVRWKAQYERDRRLVATRAVDQQA